MTDEQTDRIDKQTDAVTDRQDDSPPAANPSTTGALDRSITYVQFSGSESNASEIFKKNSKYYHPKNFFSQFNLM